MTLFSFGSSHHALHAACACRGSNLVMSSLGQDAFRRSMSLQTGIALVCTYGLRIPFFTIGPAGQYSVNAMQAIIVQAVEVHDNPLMASVSIPRNSSSIFEFSTLDSFACLLHIKVQCISQIFPSMCIVKRLMLETQNSNSAWTRRVPEQTLNDIVVKFVQLQDLKHVTAQISRGFCGGSWTVGVVLTDSVPLQELGEVTAQISRAC